MSEARWVILDPETRQNDSARAAKYRKRDARLKGDTAFYPLRESLDEARQNQEAAR